ncbi:amidase family protein [Streptomyces sp. NPDC096095]|uniref:amidase family protein n=1 Tax=Streptomyces sp. NPDC096095 TaxID=3155545 RepID=UPI00332E92D4
MPSRAPAGDDLVHLSATDALQLFARRALSPVELMRAVVERAEKVEPRVNAFTERLFDEALEQARHAEARYLGRGGPAPRPLEGIPVAAKEKHAILGRTLTPLVVRADPGRPAVARRAVRTACRSPESSADATAHAERRGRRPPANQPAAERKIL